MMTDSESEMHKEPTQQNFTGPTDAMNKHERRWRKVYGSLGFQKGYNFPLFVIFAGAMFGFALARTPYLNINTYAQDAAPGEWFWYRSGHYNVAIIMHLATAVPAGLLMVWQFIPIIRQKVILFHRINGYIVTTLLLLATVSALMLARRAFGGEVATQTAIGLLAILVVVGLSMAIYNIKRLQIDQHRAWMLRTMIWSGSIITVRLIMIISAKILPIAGAYYTTFPCDELADMMSPDEWHQQYPECALKAYAVVEANWTGQANVGAALELGFGLAFWVALFLHIAGTEIYLRLTPAESERLRMVSYERQLKAGFKYPGSAGLTVDRWGDAAPWNPENASHTIVAHV